MKRETSIKKFALYARVSTKDGRQDTGNQLIQLREYSAKQEWEIVVEYVDHETGGTVDLGNSLKWSGRRRDSNPGMAIRPCAYLSQFRR
jgi:hypothetical protein